MFMDNLIISLTVVVAAGAAVGVSAGLAALWYKYINP